MNMVNLDDGLAPIRNRFLEVMRQNQIDIQRDVEIALDIPDKTHDALGRIEVVLHKIAGTAGTLGYTAIGNNAREAEYAISGVLKERAAPPQAVFIQIIDFLEASLAVTLEDGKATT